MVTEKENVYVETSVISYLAARPTWNMANLVKQKMTHEWWQNYRIYFDLYISPFVVKEIKQGDAEAVQQRLIQIRELSELDATDEVTSLHERLMADKVVPLRASADAMHIAVATVHGMDYLLTWNCAHINNAVQKPKIHAAIVRAGYEAPTIATPEELIWKI